mmetsp:Transcript_2107/g.13697  ORF Transcript_2107/g.13697 Transcript_2107/m.13697 type:complete len:182 (+) Transcript_2107:149-694(+)
MGPPSKRRRNYGMMALRRERMEGGKPKPPISETVHKRFVYCVLRTVANMRPSEASAAMNEQMGVKFDHKNAEKQKWTERYQEEGILGLLEDKRSSNNYVIKSDMQAFINEQAHRGLTPREIQNSLEIRLLEVGQQSRKVPSISAIRKSIGRPPVEPILPIEGVEDIPPPLPIGHITDHHMQ